jgi:hypothetical protein
MIVSMTTMGVSAIGETTGGATGNTDSNITGTNTASDNTTGGTTANDNNTGGTTANDNNTGGTTANDNNTGGTTANDNNTGGNTASDNTTGGNTTGGNTTGGGTTGDGATGSGTTGNGTTGNNTTGNTIPVNSRNRTSKSGTPSVSQGAGDVVTLSAAEINANGITRISKTAVAAASAAEAEPLTIQVPVGTGKIKIEIPVSNVTFGTVVAVVNTDGSLTLVKTSVITEDGILLAIEGTTTVKVFNNGKSFSDIPAGYWAANMIDFASSRELFAGTGDGFSPDLTVTRGMMMVVLASLNGADTASASGNWYDKGVEWAVQNGFSDGSDPTGNITREQMVQMMWRVAGSPTASGDLSNYTDSGNVSDYAQDAMNWAVGAGLVSGMDDNTLAPTGVATRAQLATVMMRLCEVLANA